MEQNKCDECGKPLPAEYEFSLCPECEKKHENERPSRVHDDYDAPQEVKDAWEKK